MIDVSLALRSSSRIALLLALLGCSATATSDDLELDAGHDMSADDVHTETIDQDALDQDALDRDALDQDVHLDSEVQTDAMSDLDGTVGEGELISRTYVGSEGSRNYQLYVPAGYDGTPRPLVVALHGCSHTAAHFAFISGYNLLADDRGFLIAWPDQSALANASLCWNWFSPNHQRRDVGEAAILAAIVDEVNLSHPVDAKRVHAVGVSAGAAMSVVLGAVFPDKFASVGSVEGCPFKGTPCFASPSLLPAATLAKFVVDAMGAVARPVPMFVVQGDVDTSVPPANAEILVQQWLGAADVADDGLTNGSIPTSPEHTDSGTAPGGLSYDIDVYVDGAGKVFVERWLVHGLGHAWPGGQTALAYSDPRGPSATEASYQFFETHPIP